MNQVQAPSVTPEGRIQWLTDLPAHWEVVPSKWLFAESKIRAQEGDEQLSATQAYGVILQAEFERLEGRQVVHSFLHQDKRKHVEPDDFVISMRSFQGGLERAWARGAIRSSYVVLHPSEEVHPGFFAHLFKSTAYIQALQATSNFIRDGQDLNWNNFTLVNLPRVPWGEQKAIADFLDRKTTAIDDLIAKKQRLLDLLAEKRAALINQTVTKGLDPTVPMKDSGIPWIGEIPAHWEVMRLKDVVSMSGGSTPSKENDAYWANGTIPWISPKDMKRFRLADSIDHVTEQALNQGRLSLFPPGVVLVVVRGMILARTFPVAVTDVPATVNQDMKVLVPASNVSATFLGRYLAANSHAVSSIVEESGHGTRVLRVDLLGGFPVLLPPLGEQHRIEEHLGVQARRLASSLDVLRSSVARLQEYRQALITAAVTGNLDIPEEAAA